MTTLSEQMAADLAVFYDTELGFAESATYCPQDGVPASIPVIIEYGKGDEYQGADDFGVRAVVRFRTSDLALPDAGDDLRIDGETWKVLYAELSADRLEWIVTIDKLNG